MYFPQTSSPWGHRLIQEASYTFYSTDCIRAHFQMFLETLCLQACLSSSQQKKLLEDKDMTGLSFQWRHVQALGHSHLLGLVACPIAFRPDKRRAKPPQAQGEAMEVPTTWNIDRYNFSQGCKALLASYAAYLI